MPRARKDTLGWMLLAAVALLPRLLGAIVRRPWHDEYFTAWVAHQSWGGILGALRLDSGPPLPYAATKLMVLAGLPPIVAARTLAVLAGTIAVLLGARAARRAFGDAAGWWCGALLAVHPLAVAWSCEGRAYALLLLAGAWGWERLETLAGEGRGAVGLALAVALGCWSHGFGLLLAATLVIAALNLRGASRQRALASAAAGVASSLPWLPVAMAQPPAATAWMAQAWLTMPATEKLLAPVRLLPPLAPFGAQLDLPEVPLALQIAAALGCLALLLRSGRAVRLWALFAVPAGGLFLLASLGVPAFYGGRGEALFLLPFLALLGGSAAGSTFRRTVGVALLAGGAALTARAIHGWALRPASAEHAIAAAICDRLPAGGTVVIGGYWRLGLYFGLGRATAVFDLVNYPAEAANHPGWYDPLIDCPTTGELERLLSARLAEARRTAVVSSPGLPTASDLDRLARALGLERDITVAGGQLYLPAKRGSTP